MAIEPRVLVGLVGAAGIFAFVIGAIALGGGTQAVRRQIGQLTVLGIGLLALALVLPTLEDRFGGVFGIALLAMSAIVFVARTRRLRSQPPEVLAQRTAITGSTRGRFLVWAFIAFIVVMAVFAAVLGSLTAP